jgi:hypothetical protein
MKPQSEVNRNAAFEEGPESRNPFGVMDVPNPNDFEVARFAATARSEDSPMRMQNLGAPAMKVTAALKETGPAAGMAARTLRSRTMPLINGSRAAPKRE